MAIAWASSSSPAVALLLLASIAAALREEADHSAAPQVTLNHHDKYRVAAIEHVCYTPTEAITTESDAMTVLNTNFAILAPQVRTTAVEEGVDLVLLSEMALTSLNFDRAQMALMLPRLPAPSANGSVIPCASDEDSSMGTAATAPIDTFRALSCLARDAAVYLVANFGDRFPCPADVVVCPADGHVQYNTELVFDPSGAFIARYYKLHTFNATEFDTPPTADPTSFTMTPPRSTGCPPVRMGIVTCFDSMYPDPVLPLIHDGVTNFVLSHWWVNQYATMSSSSWFQSISDAYDINLVFAASVWEKIFPWGSGSGVVSAGSVIDVRYRARHANVTVGNDEVIVADMPLLKGPTLGPALPKYTPAVTRAEKPLPMCFNISIVTAAELNAAASTGTPIQRSVPCLEFTCTVTAEAATSMLSAGAPNNDAPWVLENAWGYYPMPDGNGVYYFEQYCSFFQCGSTVEDCSGLRRAEDPWIMINDDHGGRVFDSFELSADFDIGSVIFPMVLGGNGDVPANVDSTSSLTYIDRQPVEGSIVESLVRLKVDQGATAVLGATMLGRNFAADMRVGGNATTRV